MSGIQETLKTILPIHVYINRINNSLVFKIKDGHKLELQKSEAIIWQHKKVDNQYQQTFEILLTFMPNKSYPYLLNVEPSNLVFLKTYNTEFFWNYYNVYGSTWYIIRNRTQS